MPIPLTLQVGLLSKDNTEQIPFAYTLYESGSDRHAEDYKKMFCRPVPIDFVGVWWVLMTSNNPCFDRRAIDR